MIALLFAFVGFLALGLATDDHHHRQFGRRAAAERRRALRVCGWAAIVAALPAAFATAGASSGPILWAGTIMLAAGIVFLILNFLPSRKKSRPSPFPGDAEQDR